MDVARPWFPWRRPVIHSLWRLKLRLDAEDIDHSPASRVVIPHLDVDAYEGRAEFATT